MAVARFRVRAKHIYLTYPQVGEDEPDMEQWLVRLREFNNPVGVVAARERHQDGNWHVHALLHYSSLQKVNNPRAFDIDGHHPNVQGAKDFKAVMDYIKKEGNFIEWGKLPGVKADRNEVKIRIAQGEISYIGGLRECRGLASGVAKHQQDIDMLRQMMEQEEHDYSVEDRDITVYWLYGETGKGKSHFHRTKFPRAYPVPLTGKFFGRYNGQKAIVLDDYNADPKQSTGFTYAQINRMLDKNPFEIEVKGGHMWAAWEVVVITSNAHPEHIYPNNWHTGELRRRIHYLINYSSPLERLMFLNDHGMSDRPPQVASETLLSTEFHYQQP